MQLTLINGEGAEHDIVFPDQNTKSPRVTGKGASTTIAFRATKSGDFIYFCSVPGHQLAGMQGQFIVTSRPAPQTLVEAAQALSARRPAGVDPAAYIAVGALMLAVGIVASAVPSIRATRADPNLALRAD